MQPVNASLEAPRASLLDLARFFLRLSGTAFGGPIGHMAIMEQEIVRRRKWLTHDHFLDLIAAANLIPGPSSTETVIHIGYSQQKIAGAIVAGTCFILPSFLITLMVSILYVNYGGLPLAQALLWGIQPVVVAIIAVAAYRLAKSALKTRTLIIVCVLSLIAIGPLHVPGIFVMLGAGVAHVLAKRLHLGSGVGMLAVFGLGSIPRIPMLAAATVSLWDVFFYFFKIGSVLYGSGYVLVAYLQQDVVNTLGWLTPRQLLDAIAIGQVTPGPLFSSAAVVGSVVAGVPGAITATIAIFLPAFILVILTAPLVPKMRTNKILSIFLAGVNAGVIALIVWTMLGLTQAAIYTPDGQSLSPLAIGWGLVCVLLFVRTRISPTWLILIGGVIGVAQSLLMVTH